MKWNQHLFLNMRTDTREGSWSHSNSSSLMSKKLWQTLNLFKWWAYYHFVMCLQVQHVLSVWYQSMYSSNYQFLFLGFSFCIPWTMTRLLADISGSQQLSSFLSLAFPWLDIYPSFDWLKQSKYALPTYPLFSWSLSIKKTLLLRAA